MKRFVCEKHRTPSHGKTGRFTVWLNGKQNPGLENFVPESC